MTVIKESTKFGASRPEDSIKAVDLTNALAYSFNKFKFGDKERTKFQLSISRINEPIYITIHGDIKENYSHFRKRWRPLIL